MKEKRREIDDCIDDHHKRVCILVVHKLVIKRTSHSNSQRELSPLHWTSPTGRQRSVGPCLLNVIPQTLGIMKNNPFLFKL